MFTPVESSIGAVIMQYATSSYMKMEGKVIGFSGILYNSVFRPSISSLSIILGLFISTGFVKSFLPSLLPTPVLQAGTGLLSYGSTSNNVVAGFLVGLGTSAGCGCTSGHMLAGLSRLRWRSLVATGVFFSTAVITNLFLNKTDVIQSLNGACYQYDTSFTFFKENIGFFSTLVLAAGVWSYGALPYLGKVLKQKGYLNIAKCLAGVSSGFLFGSGLIISGMTQPEKVSGFLSLFDLNKFDPSLAMIPLFCIIPNIVIWKNWLPQSKTEKLVNKKPILASTFDLNFSDKTDMRFLVGNAIFGVGWGLAGICPGPAIIGTFLNGCGSNHMLWVLSFLAGSLTEKCIN